MVEALLYMVLLFFFSLLTLLGLQSDFGDRSVKFQVVCPQNGTAVLKGLRGWREGGRQAGKERGRKEGGREGGGDRNERREKGREGQEGEGRRRG